ncbi:MAG: anaerobic ribonucleoside-triphosphate reductase activating protein [Chitinispirillales bacterium]|jgi:pyruvate formate lyase activating enzyme|nr:anaerobic ribonucleoside-triphosphate reductase activating protein [Chitinispirillales bacterium]
MDCIVGWQKTSLIDFPGTVSTVLFLFGCNLRCPYCHNPGIVLEQYETLLYNDIREHIIKRKGIVEGAVISGGEPSIHSGLQSLCDDLRSLGLRVKIDTNGLEPEVINSCAADYLALDIKTAIEKYPRLNVRQSYNDYRERLGMSIDIVKRMGKNAEIRITAVPGIIDESDIDSLLIDLRGVGKIFIQPFNPSRQMIDPAYSSVKPYEQRELEVWRRRFLDAGIDCEVRNP